ncbi:MAG: hypothetical protein WBN57_09115 [Gammaproteobacteria bacterium]
MCAAIREYAHAAWPPGGSECAQTARYTLLELAADIDAGISADSAAVEISKRPKAMIRAAIDYYFNRQDDACKTSSVHQRELFVSLLDEKTVGVDDMEAAVAADRAG